VAIWEFFTHNGMWRNTVLCLLLKQRNSAFIYFKWNFRLLV